MNPHERGGPVSDLLLGRLIHEGRRLADAYRSGEADRRVPGLDWTAREVVAHTGAVHRWTTDLVARSLPADETGGSGSFAWTGAEDALLEWFDEGLARLVAVLRSSPADLSCFTFISGVPAREFWIRRQAHETAIHRADVEAAVGLPVTEVEPWFAQDGLGEVVGAFAGEAQFAIHSPGRLVLAASDGPSWQVTFHAGGNRVSSGQVADAEGDAVVRGSSDALYRWAWNRPVADLEIIGDLDVVVDWQRTVRVT